MESYAYGETVLHRAIRFGNVELFKEIIHPLLINNVDIEGKSPLHLAAEHADRKGYFIISKLLELKLLDAQIKDRQGHTALDIAKSKKPPYDPIVSLLAEYSSPVCLAAIATYSAIYACSAIATY